MSQQINLFNPIFLKQKKYFSAITMLQALTLILFGYGLLVVYTNFQLSARTKEAAAVAAQLLKTKGQLISVTAQFGPRQNNLALDDDIKKTQADINKVQHVFDALQSGAFGNTKGYSDYFRAFARQIVDGLWLTGVGIVGAGRDISLRGRALDPELVPVYLTRLKHEPKMQGKSFSELDMQTPKADAPASPGGDAKTPTAPTQAAFIEFNLQSFETTDAGGSAGAKSK